MHLLHHYLQPMTYVALYPMMEGSTLERIVEEICSLDLKMLEIDEEIARGAYLSLVRYYSLDHHIAGHPCLDGMGE